MPLGNFDYVNCRETDLFKSLNFYTTCDRSDYFLLIWMFEAINGIAPDYLSDRIAIFALGDFLIVVWSQPVV